MQLASLIRTPLLVGLFALVAFFGAVAPAQAAVDGDGYGVLTVTPTSAVTGDTNLSFVFDFTQSPQSTVARLRVLTFALLGSQLVLTIPAEWPAPQLTDELAPGYLSIEEGAGGGLLGLNSCDYDLVPPFISGSGAWELTVFQHCLRNDHLTISYENVTAPAAGVYEFTGWTRAGLTGGAQLDESPTITVSPICEEGYHADGINCVANEPPFCPKGFHIETGMCVPNSEVSPAPCPSGMLYSSESGMCEAAPTPPSCPEGLTFSSELDMCVDTTPTAPTCPSGTFNGMHCTSGDTFVPAVCPEGQVFVGGEEGLGRCELPSQNPTCPSGLTLNTESNMCEADEVAPSCPEHYELGTSEGPAFCVFVPFPPSCIDGFHLSEDHTACFVDTTPPAEEERNDGGGENHNMGVSEEDSDSEVLGAETGPDDVCTPLVTEYFWAGKENDPEQMKAIQEFLNKELSLTLELTGVYDAATTEAVNAFQLKYWEEVLAPWVPFGLATDHTTTGRIYKLTQWKINAIHCAPIEVPMPTLP